MNISVVIPTLNEANSIRRTLDSVRSCGDCEIVVCDGDSADGTAEQVTDLATLVRSRRGRAIQMNAGASAARGDVLLFLHADTLLPPNAFEGIRNALGDKETIAGCFRLRFDSPSRLLRLYGACTALPFKSFCFGDRGLFVKRQSFDRVHGFPEIPIFEDLEIVRILTDIGRFARIRDYVTTSGRRFDRHGHIRQQLSNARLWFRYHTGGDPWLLASRYTYDPDETQAPGIVQ